MRDDLRYQESFAAGGDEVDDPAPSAERSELHWEVERLLGIARRHAKLALTRPEDGREVQLARYRTVWVRYAASFSDSPAEHERFAGALDRATRQLMSALSAGDAPRDSGIRFRRLDRDPPDDADDWAARRLSPAWEGSILRQWFGR